MSESTIVLTTDQHMSDAVTVPVGKIVGAQADGQWVFGGLHYRWWKNAEANQLAAATLATSLGADLLVDLGDITDSVATDYQTALETMMTQRNTFSGNKLNVNGNHELSDWGADFTDYYTAVDNGHVTRANESGDEQKSFTFDLNGIRYVAVGYAANPMSAGMLTWLEAALVTSLPIVILTHYHFQESNAQGGFGPYSNVDDIIAIVEAAKTVQVVFQGHHHLATNGFRFVNDILYCDMAGSVLGPPDGSQPSATQLTYYAITIQPDAYMGDSRMRANVAITGYSQGNSRVQEAFHAG